MLQALAVVVGRLGLTCRVLLGFFPLLKGWRYVSKRREQADSAASQDQDGSQQQGWKGSWAGVRVHTW